MLKTADHLPRDLVEDRLKKLKVYEDLKKALLAAKKDFQEADERCKLFMNLDQVSKNIINKTIKLKQK
ncbi:MAG: hypothetical protein ACFFKA_13990 [Candidatus Thorarchaeota archaeon]